ncbi:MAG: IPT/TIG domain-containing protein [Anaerolineae bacterium]|nr:IPT/TIG domain-containing protein [Gloeobacterales cyanobacterium ES-bin-313]
MRRFLPASLLLIGCLFVPTRAFAAPMPASLFNGAGKIQSGITGEPTVKRQRAINIDFNQLAAPIDLGSSKSVKVTRQLVLPLFEDVSFQVNLNQVEQPKGRSSMVWTGQIEGAPGAQVILVHSGNILSGTISFLDGRLYQIRYQPNGTHVVREIDQRFFPSESDSIPAVAFPDKTSRKNTIESPTLTATTSANPDNGSTIDVMVVYTASAASAVGGAAAMQNLIDLGISETNQGYTNSGVIQRVRLVHAEQVNYNENTASPYNDALNAITNTTDGQMDNVLSLRNQHGADLVSLWINNGQYCGLAWQMGTPSSSFESYGYSTVYYSCATGYYSFGHEMGHNMGSNHDRANASGAASYTYSYGYQDPSNQFRTVMAYNCAVGCPRINYYSNPAILYSGLPTGVDPNASTSADNALSFNNTRTIVANFRAAAAPPSISSLSPTSGYTGQSVTINGSGFTGTTSIKLNGMNASFTLNSDTQITSSVPSGASSGPFTVTDDIASAASSNFTVTPAPVPAVSMSASPSSQTVGIGSSAAYAITLNRTNFTSPVTLSLSSIPSGVAASFAPNPATGSTATLTVSTSSNAPLGTSAMTVIGTASGVTIAPIGVSLTVASQPPSISSFSPSSGKFGTVVTITGSGFTGATSVRFNGAAASFSVLSSTQIQTTVPSGASTGAIQVITPSGSTTSSKSFRVR